MSLETAARRRLQHRTDARRAILDATESLLVEDGYEGFSMRRLADRCGYTAPTIYHYFGDKPRLLDALLEERCGKLVESLRRVKLSESPEENLRLLARAFVRFGLRNPTHYRLLTQPRDPDREPVPSAERAREILAQPMETLAAAGRLALEDVELARQSLWALLHGLISLQTNRPDYAWSKRLFDRSFDAMLHGLLRADTTASELQTPRRGPKRCK